MCAGQTGPGGVWEGRKGLEKALAGAGADSSWTPVNHAHGLEMPQLCQEPVGPAASSPTQAWPDTGALKLSPVCLSLAESRHAQPPSPTTLVPPRRVTQVGEGEGEKENVFGPS